MQEAELLILIVEKEKHDHQGAAHRHVDIGDIEHRKIDRAEIDEIDDILLTDTVDEITDRTRKNQLAYEQQRQKMPVFPWKRKIRSVWESSLVPESEAFRHWRQPKKRLQRRDQAGLTPFWYRK